MIEEFFQIEMPLEERLVPRDGNLAKEGTKVLEYGPIAGVAYDLVGSEEPRNILQDMEEDGLGKRGSGEPVDEGYVHPLEV